jgi:DNA-directed RNA polymerase sigma subunit (sigma70/sigma32)
MRLEAVHAALVLREGRDVTLDEWALEAQLPPRTLKHRIHSGKAAKVLMVEHNVRLAVHVARRYANKGVPMGDLVQEGMSGLIRAIEKFDPALGFRFSTYAHYWVRQVRHLLLPPYLLAAA